MTMHGKRLPRRSMKRATRPCGCKMSDEYSVVLFFPDESHHYEARELGAEEAVWLAKECSERPAAHAGFIRRIIITDADDFAVFQWEYGKGVIYPRHDGEKFVGDGE